MDETASAGFNNGSFGLPGDFNVAGAVDTLAGIAGDVRQATGDLRTVAAYGGQEVRRAIRDGNTAPLDDARNVPWVQRLWLHASDTEKASIILGVVALIVAFAAHK